MAAAAAIPTRRFTSRFDLVFGTHEGLNPVVAIPTNPTATMPAELDAAFLNRAINVFRETAEKPTYEKSR